MLVFTTARCSVGWRTVLYTKRLWVQSLVRVCMGGNQSMFLSLFLSLPLSLKSIYSSSGEDIKKKKLVSSRSRILHIINNQFRVTRTNLIVVHQMTITVGQSRTYKPYYLAPKISPSPICKKNRRHYPQNIQGGKKVGLQLFI